MPTNLILGIETSCDETAVAVVANGNNVLSNVVASQIKEHALFGGVVPEYAARLHVNCINDIVTRAINDANIKLDDIDAIAVTNGPGLIPSLLVGITFAKGLSTSRFIPLFGINHILAHTYSIFLDDNNHNDLLNNKNIFPMLSLVVSGGHTVILLIDEKNLVTVVGTTIDDAAGEALDKGARIMGLEYPGGPIIENMAKKGDKNKYYFPRAIMQSNIENRLNFSFSGLKTALINHINKLGGIERLSDEQLYDTIASYQFAVIDVLCKKIAMAVDLFSCKTVTLSGGVAQNSELREELEKKISSNIVLRIAPKVYCGDNGAMVAGLCWYDKYYCKRECDTVIKAYSSGYSKMF